MKEHSMNKQYSYTEFRFRTLPNFYLTTRNNTKFEHKRILPTFLTNKCKLYRAISFENAAVLLRCG